MREKLAKVADRIKGLRDRQETAGKQTRAVNVRALKAKKWQREHQETLSSLADIETGLADELDSLVQQRFQAIKVVARLLEQSSDAMRRSAKQIDGRNKEISDRAATEPFDPAAEEKAQAEIEKWQDLALRRLDQLLEIGRAHV